MTNARPTVNPSHFAHALHQLELAQIARTAQKTAQKMGQLSRQFSAVFSYPHADVSNAMDTPITIQDSYFNTLAVFTPASISQLLEMLENWLAEYDGRVYVSGVLADCLRNYTPCPINDWLHYADWLIEDIHAHIKQSSNGTHWAF
jgi:hypothetical protein